MIAAFHRILARRHLLAAAVSLERRAASLEAAAKPIDWTRFPFRPGDWSETCWRCRWTATLTRERAYRERRRCPQCGADMARWAKLRHAAQELREEAERLVRGA